MIYKIIDGPCEGKVFKDSLRYNKKGLFEKQNSKTGKIQMLSHRKSCDCNNTLVVMVGRDLIILVGCDLEMSNLSLRGKEGQGQWTTIGDR